MYAKKILLKSDNICFAKYGFGLWPKLSHNVTTLDNDDIDISMGHILLFPKIYNLALCHTIKANRQKMIPCYNYLVHFHHHDCGVIRHMYAVHDNRRNHTKNK